MKGEKAKSAVGMGRHLSMLAAWGLSIALASNRVYLFTAEVEMKDTYAEKGFDGILLKPANLDSLRKLLP